MVALSFQTTTFDRIHNGLSKKHHQNTSCETTDSEVLAIPCDPMTKPQTVERQCENLQPYPTHLHRTMEVHCKHLNIRTKSHVQSKERNVHVLVLSNSFDLVQHGGLPIWATFKPPSINHVRATTTEELGWIGSVLGSASHFPSGS